MNTTIATFVLCFAFLYLLEGIEIAIQTERTKFGGFGVRKAVLFEEFALRCPYFYSYEEENINNYYNCNHPKQEEVEEADSGQSVGKCYCFRCPLGIEAEQEDLEDKTIDWDGLCEDGEVYDVEYLLVEIGEEATEEQKKAMWNYELYMNRYNKKWLDEHAVENSFCD